MDLFGPSTIVYVTMFTRDSVIIIRECIPIFSYESQQYVLNVSTLCLFKGCIGSNLRKSIY